MRIFSIFIVYFLGMVAMTVSAAGTEEYVAVKKCGYSFTLASCFAEEMKTAKWSAVFKLNDNSNRYGDTCLCAVTTDGSPYISSPDGTQEFIIRDGSIKKVSNPEISFDKGDVWVEYGQPFVKNKIKYVYGYDIDDNVYVVIYGN